MNIKFIQKHALENDMSIVEAWQEFAAKDNTNFLKVKEYYNAIVASNKLEKKMDLLNELYSFVKSIASFYYQDLKNYAGIKNLILYSEQAIPKEYIINIAPSYKYKETRKIPSLKDEEYIIKYIVSKVRDQLYQISGWPLTSKKDILKVDLTGECFDAAAHIKQLATSLNLKAQIYNIRPGFIKKGSICDYCAEHAFVIVTINETNYLIDVTFSQYFAIATSSLKRTGLLNFMGPSVGIYMLMDSNRKKVADKILKDGYIKLTSQELKYYLDGFTNFYRNGTYYERTNDFTYTPEYQVDDYMRFLQGKDNQLNHEDKESLAYQKLPLKNPNMDFSKR